MSKKNIALGVISGFAMMCVLNQLFLEPIGESNSHWFSAFGDDLGLFLTGTFTLLGSLVGWLISYYSLKATHIFEWSKNIWDKYENQFIQFLETVEKTEDAEMIEKTFRSTRGGVFWPDSLVKDYENLIKVLKTETSEDKRKKEKDEFLLNFRKFLRYPWKYIA
jgi:hypothetical protein